MTIHDLTRHKDLKTTMIFTHIVNRSAGVGHSVLCAVTLEAIYRVRPAARRITLILISSLTRRVGCA